MISLPVISHRECLSPGVARGVLYRGDSLRRFHTFVSSSLPSDDSQPFPLCSEHEFPRFAQITTDAVFIASCDQISGWKVHFHSSPNCPLTGPSMH